jgi:hypothetical protein
MTALEHVVPLFRAAAFSHIEILLFVWPQSSTAMWKDILDRQAVTDDVHRAAAEVSAEYADRLRAVLLPTADDVHVTIVETDVVAAVRSAIVEFAADVVFFLIGNVAADSEVAIGLQQVLRETPVPVAVLHAPAQVAALAAT